jgi:hypothetical protein
MGIDLLIINGTYITWHRDNPEIKGCGLTLEMSLNSLFALTDAIAEISAELAVEELLFELEIPVSRE